MPNTVSLKIKIDDEGSFKKLEVDSNDLKNAIAEVTKESKRLKAAVVNWAEAARAADLLGSAIQQLYGGLKGMTDAYAAQSSAETRLAQAMRNTMGASDEEIQSIKDLTTAQQQIGIVGDEVQLAAAQELATYLEYSSSLKAIIPVMNDMIAQQLGLGASAESATQIATMLGKVMNGQTEALSRYGYKFDDAQKYILKYGDESERAAVLAQVVEESVGGMNEAMGKTPAGQMQQSANAVGDLKERIGEALQGCMPLISKLAEVGNAASGILKLGSTLKALCGVLENTKVHTLGLAAAERLQAAAAKIWGISAKEAATATGILKAEIIATEAAITLGLSLAISALVEWVSRLIGRSKGVSAGLEEASDAEDSYRQAASASRMEVAKDIVELEDLIKKKKEEGAKVSELNGKYGDILGTYSSAAEWYDVLTRKSSLYVRQLANEARQTELNAKLQGKEDELKSVFDRMRQMRADGSAFIKTAWGKTKFSDGYEELASQAKTLQGDISSTKSELSECADEAKRLADELSGAGQAADNTWKTMSLADLKKAIQGQEALVESLAGVSGKEAEAKAQKAILAQMKARKTLLEKNYGLGSGKSDEKEKYNGDKLIENARSYLEAGNNVKYYQNQIDKADQSNLILIQELTAQRDEWKRVQKEIKQTYEALSLPVTTDSLEDIEAHLAYWQSLKPSAGSDEERARIEAEIRSLKDLQTAVELASYTPLKDDEIKTFRQLDREIEYYTALVQNSAGADRIAAQQKLDARNKIKEAWHEELDMLKTPAPIGQLNTLKDIDEALSIYQARTQRQQGDELAGTYRIIEALQRKRAVIEQMSSIPEMQREISELDSLSGKELKIELDLIGLDGVRSKLRELRKLLKDATLGDEQRKDVMELIAAYTRYENRIRRSNLSLSESWSTMRGLGNSIESLTEALKEDGFSWQKLASIIDSTLGVYEAVKGIVEIVKALTGASEAHAAAKGVEAGAEAAEAASSTAAAATNAAAAAVETAANKTAMISWLELAKAINFATYAEIPYVGPAIAEGFNVAMMTSIAATKAAVALANGGIIYGPTLALMGEYAGASGNPEVVAPLNKLKGLLDIGGGAPGGPIELRVRGRDLVAVLNNENNMRRRS